MSMIGLGNVVFIALSGFNVGADMSMIGLGWMEKREKLGFNVGADMSMIGQTKALSAVLERVSTSAPTCP